MTETITMELQNQTKLFELFKVKDTLPKKEWPPEALLNSAISKCVWDNDKGHYVFLTLSDEKYSAAITNFINKLQDNDIEAGSAYVAVNYTQIIYVPEDTKTNMMGKDIAQKFVDEQLQ